MPDQWFLFTGENAYELDAEKRRWVRNFAEKYGPENIVELSGKSLTASILINEVGSAPFIAEKRLIVLDGLPTVEKEDVKGILNSIHEKTLVLCIEAKPDKRFASNKVFLSEMTVHNFPQKTGESILRWLLQLSSDFSVNLPRAMALHLVSKVGEDQCMLASEMRKIASYVGVGGSVNQQHIDDLVILGTERAVWQLMDHFSKGDSKETLSLARMILEKGESPYGLWNMLLWMVSQLSLVGAFSDSGSSNPSMIAKEAGVSFQTVRALLPMALHAEKGKVSAVCTWFANADVDLKTGRLKSTAEAPDELQALIDCGLLNLCALVR